MAGSPLVTVTALVPPGIKLTGMVSASANASPSDDGILIPFGQPQQVPQDTWNAWKTQIGVPSGLLNVVVTGP
jgi:hypothetical protein